MDLKQGEEDWLEVKAKQLDDAATYDPIMLDELQEICKEYAERFGDNNIEGKQ